MGRGLTVVAATVPLDVMVGGTALREGPVEAEVAAEPAMDNRIRVIVAF